MYFVRNTSKIEGNGGCMTKTPEWLSQCRGELVALRKQQDALYQRLMNPPPDMKAGSLSLQYKRCGKAACKCMRTENPEKHGPYYYLITCQAGKTVLRYVKSQDDREAIQRYETYEAQIKEYLALHKKVMDVFVSIKEKCSHGR